jgi:tetratricopeptide (TPR) repeat protein
MRDSVQRFAATLKSGPAAEVPACSFVDMKDEDHSSTPQRSLYNALEARYAEWRFPFFENHTELDQAGGLQGLESHYQRFSKRFGYNAPPPLARLQQVGRIYIASGRHDDVLRLARTYVAQYPGMSESLVNQVGYDQLKRGQVDRAVQTFKKNAEAFPESPNVYDSLGDGYCRAGDDLSARQSYQQAANVAEKLNPSSARISWYRDKAKKGCAPQTENRP